MWIELFSKENLPMTLMLLGLFIMFASSAIFVILLVISGFHTIPLCCLAGGILLLMIGRQCREE
jgi:hypothetical protein